MKSAFLAILFCGLTLCCVEAHAQACPPGTYSVLGGVDVPNGSYCAPMQSDDDDPDSYDGSSAPAVVEPQWEERWGAIATGEGAFGAGLSFSTEQGAIDRALSECVAHTKGKPCRVRQTFHNQCAALAGGDTGSIAWSSSEVGIAKQKAVAACSQHTKNCEVLYSGCSYPERVQ